MQFILKCSVVSVHILYSDKVTGAKCKAHGQKNVAKFHIVGHTKADWLNAKRLLQCVMHLII